MVFSKIWHSYRRYVESAIHNKVHAQVKDIAFWRNRLFKNFILYSIPVSFTAMLPAIIIGLKEGHPYIIAFETGTIILIAIIALNKRLKLPYRKAFVVLMIYILALIIILNLGSFGPGVLYLLAISVFSTLIFSARVAYASVALHAISCTFFAIVIYFKLFSSPLIQEYTLGSWIAFSSNLIFLSLICVVLINKIIYGLESTIIHEQMLYNKLRAEGIERAELHQKIKESEGHYKSLFVQNPSPMWVVDTETLKFIQVNDAAIYHYGYSKEEFLAMSVFELRLADDIELRNVNFHNLFQPGKQFHYTTKHLTKNKQIIDVDVRCNTIIIGGKQAILAIGRDITAETQHLQAIESQNSKLQEIAYIQSHVVRSPLAKIMGLVGLIKLDMEKKPDPEVIKYLDKAAEEFDLIIKQITDHTSQIDLQRLNRSS